MNETLQVQYRLDRDTLKRVRGLCEALNMKTETAINEAMQDWLQKQLKNKLRIKK